MCRCDMFLDEHPDGYVDADGVTCEMALPGPRISPHLELILEDMGIKEARGAPPLSDRQLSTLRRILDPDQAYRAAGAGVTPNPAAP